MYKLTNANIIIRLSDGASIPADPANIDYAAYLAWLSEGNTPEPADPIPAATALEKIRALEAQHADAQARMTRQSLLAIALDKACAEPAASGLTRDQVHALLMNGDNGYAALWSLEQQVNALRGQL